MLAQAEPDSPRPIGLSGRERVELKVIEDRLTDLRRRDIAAERAAPSSMVTEILGPRPKDSVKAALWNEGVETIYAYWQRYGVSPSSASPLGPKPDDPVRSAERRQAELRLARVQQRLGREHVHDAERLLQIAR